MAICNGVWFFLFGDLREMLDNRVEQVAGPGAVHCRNGEHLTQAERVELERLLAARLVVCLVCGEHYGLRGAAEDLGDVLVGSGNPVARIHQKYDNISFLDRELGLLPDLAHEISRRAGQRLGLAPLGGSLLGGGDIEPARVHQDKWALGPFGIGVKTVAGSARLVLDDGQALTYQAVE